MSETPPIDIDPPVELYTCSYAPNPAGGHNPKLLRIEPAPGGEPGSRLNFAYDATGNQTTAAAISGEESGRTSFLGYSAESRLSRLSTSNGPSSTELLYDGRGFLRRSRLTATTTSDFEQTEPIYSSEGLLLARRYHKQSTGAGGGDTGAPPTTRVVMETAYVFYLAGRPVAQLTRSQLGAAPDRLLYLTTDHLGTPIQATDTSGAVVWEGGLDPFGTPFLFPASRPPGEGEDPQEPPEGGDGDASVVGLSASTSTMESAGIFLRFPGQWDDPSFRAHGLGGGLYYNVHRWHEPLTGRYTQLDPLGFDGGQENLYIYAGGNPLRLTDPLGLAVTFAPACQRLLSSRQRQTVQRAAEDADAAGFQCLQCPERDRYRRAIRGLTIRCAAVSRVACIPNAQWCGARVDFTQCSTAPLPGNTIILTPDGANGTGGCPCLPRVIMHEVLHILRGPGHPGGGITYPEVRRCLRNCGRGYPGTP